MKISNRLKVIASFIKDNSNVIDVGADHGLLEIYLIEQNKVNSLFAVENKVGPYTILKNNLKDYKVDLSLSDGISEMPKHVDTIVIAGMGGILISDILKAHKEKLTDVKQIVVDAHRDNRLVRENITKLGYYIEKEQIVFENNKYYFVISFLKGHKDYSEDELEWGYNVKQDPLFEDYKKHELETMSLNLVKYRSSEKSTKVGIEIKEAKIRRLTNL